MSRCRTGSRSMPAGSMPPTVSTPCAQRLLEQLGRARVGQQAVLREGDLLDVTRSVQPRGGGRARPRRRRARPRDRCRCACGRTWCRRPPSAPAARRCCPGSAAPARARRQRSLAIRSASASPRRVRHPRPAVQRLVEMAVRLDQPRQHEPVRRRRRPRRRRHRCPARSRRSTPSRTRTSAGLVASPGRQPRSSTSRIAANSAMSGPFRRPSG